MKLDDQVDKLNKEREKIKRNEVFYVVSDHYILLGKKVIKEVGTNNFAQAFCTKQNISPQARSEVNCSVKRFPARYYGSYKVCFNCFKVYSVLMKQFRKSDVKKNKKKVLPDRPARNYYESEIGIINKDNLNDLLVDISFYKNLRKGACNDVLRSQYASMTEYSLNKCLEKREATHSSTTTSSSQVTVSKSQSSVNFKIRTKKRVLSKVAQFYMGKSLKIT